EAADATVLGHLTLAAALLPTGALDHLLDACAEAHRADAQEVGGQRVARREVVEPQLRRVEAEVAGDLVELHLEREARLRRAVAALGPARRLVGEEARAAEVVV